MAFRFKSLPAILLFFLCGTPAGLGQIVAQAPAEIERPNQSMQNSGDDGPAASPSSDQESPGSVSGTVVDQSGAVVARARVTLTIGNQSGPQAKVLEAVAGANGEFFFPNVAPGAFQLTVIAAGFGSQTFSGSVRSGQTEVVPPIALTVADALTEVDVSMTQAEVAEEQIKIEEKQRVLGVVPNFYVTYIPDAAPLTAKQKFKLAFRAMIDPFTVFIAASVAGIEQGQNHFAEYGQGAQGYGKRFGASYADATTGTLFGAAVFPALLKQDPRYFYKGTGGVSSRALYAIASSVICKGDNRKWQPNYSNMLGTLAAGGISNLYYPEQDRNGVGLTFENAAIGLIATSASNLFQEFVVRKLTPKSRKQGQDH